MFGLRKSGERIGISRVCKARQGLGAREMKRSAKRKDESSTRELTGKFTDGIDTSLDWLNGNHGPARKRLPSLQEMPVPTSLSPQTRLHPDRPTGSKPMLDVSAAKKRLAIARPGAWLVSVFTGWKWAKWPDGDVGWVPKSTELPRALRVDCRDDLQ